VDWERAQWLIPAERMKAGKSHTVYLAEQALDVLTTLRTCFPSSRFIHPSRYDSSAPISQATLNWTIAAAVDWINEDRTRITRRFCRSPFTTYVERSRLGSTTRFFRRL
jgi:integrase